MSAFKEQGPDSPVFDETEALARTGNDRELFGELTQMILAGLPGMLSEIESALNQQDAPRAHRAAHNLKGHLGTVGAGPVVAAAQELDASARVGDLPRARLAYSALLPEIERLRPILEAWLAANY